MIPSSRLASPRLSHGERIRGVRAARTRRLWRKLSKPIDFRTRPDLDEPFDFLTWFEFPPAAAEAFEELNGRLRATEEWTYVEREVDIRLTREPGR